MNPSSIFCCSTPALLSSVETHAAKFAIEPPVRRQIGSVSNILNILSISFLSNTFIKSASSLPVSPNQMTRN